MNENAEWLRSYEVTENYIRDLIFRRGMAYSVHHCLNRAAQLRSMIKTKRDEAEIRCFLDFWERHAMPSSIRRRF